MRELLILGGHVEAPAPAPKIKIYINDLDSTNISAEDCIWYHCMERISLQEPTVYTLTPEYDSVKGKYYVEIEPRHYLVVEIAFDDVECPICSSDNVIYCHLDIFDAEDQVITMDEVWQCQETFPTYQGQWGAEDDGCSIGFWYECSEADCEGRGEYDPNYGQGCGEPDECGRTPDDPDYGQPCDEPYDPCATLDECGRCEDDPDYGMPCDGEEEPEEEPIEE